MNDPFAADWNAAPQWATAHVVCQTGRGLWLESADILGDGSPWYAAWPFGASRLRPRRADSRRYPRTPNWRISLRSRPAEVTE